jgi:hypothetical protein
MTTLLFDIGPPGGSAGIAAIVGAFFVLAAVAYVIFRLLRKTVRVAFRLAIVAAILMIGLLGAMFFFSLGSGTGRPVGSPPPRTR